MSYDGVPVGRELLAGWRKPTGQAHAEAMKNHLHFCNNAAGSFLGSKGKN